MRKPHTNLLLACFAASLIAPQAFAQANATAAKTFEPLQGFYYGAMASPTGWEWQSVDSLAFNKLQPHAYMFSFASAREALGVLPETSSYVKSLNGTWRFHWASNPDERPANFFEKGYDVSAWDEVSVPMNWNVAGIQADGSLKYGKPIYSNQRVIFQHQIAEGDWKKGVMREPRKDWLTYKDRNEVGSYVRTFTVPAEWKGRQVVLNFDGVDPFFYLYVNGKYVGFSKNSRNLASFDITPYLVKGENTLAVEVYRNTDASFLESQDMFRLPGIFRDVYLTSKPAAAQVYDLVAIPDYDASYTKASLHVSARLKTPAGKAAKGLRLRYSLFEIPLYGDRAEKQIAAGSKEAAVADIAAVKGGEGELVVPTTITLGAAVKPWSAESPQRYTLVCELLDKKGNVVETVSANVGFRKVEIKETAAKDDEFGLAGRYYYLNGQPIKMKGVNRHENNPNTGHYVTRQQMEQEAQLMKRANINHVRNCHYPDAPYWYYVCDKYGIYLEDEANIESHEYSYGRESLSHPAEWRNAHVDRNLEMVHATVNAPSVVIWSLGNEAGPGNNFVEAYKAIKRFDTSRPVQYERNNNIVDMGSNQYPSIPWVQEAVKGKYNMVYPFHISEYAHSMGNAVGNLVDYWDAIESTNFFIGGAIWDWVDQAISTVDPATGKTYWGYGGDFGDKPNDGMFCMNGIMRPDLTPKAQYFEVKKVYQYVGVKAIDMTKGLVEIFNKNYFEPISGQDIVFTLWKDGQCVQKANLSGLDQLAARTTAQVTLPYDYASLDPESEYFAKIQFVQQQPTLWADAGYVQSEEQLLVRTAQQAAPSVAEAAKATTEISLEQTADRAVVKGEGWTATFDLTSGAIHSLEYAGRTMIADGNGPKLDAFRAPTDNDDGIGYPSAWFRNGLYALQHHAKSANVTKLKNGNVQLTFSVESKAAQGGNHGYSNRDRNPQDVYTFDNGLQPLGDSELAFGSNLVYTVYPDGSIELQSAISANRAGIVLPRIGYAMKLDKSLSNYSYYGRGPENNYADRRTGSFIQQYNATVASQGIMLPKPQAMGNREEVRWSAVTDAAGRGLVFVSDSVMSASALPWSQQQLTTAAHPFQLPESDGTYVHLDAKVTGLGGASCGQGGPLPDDRTMSANYDFGFIIRPVSIGRAVPAVIGETARVSAAGEQPISMSRSRAGLVTLSTKATDRTILYTVDGQKKPQVYKEPFAFKQGGTITAWYKENPDIKATDTYAKIDIVAIEVVGASDQEPQGGQAANLVDGDPATIWHSIYSITLAKYPHYVDFDAAETKTMKGFTYLQRQEGGNGMIKDFEIYVSQDGKTWGEPIMKGQLQRTTKEQRVLFPKAVKARYIRFQALSEQSGQEFASGAEFGLIAD